MTRAEVLYLLPYILSLALSLGVLYYTWNRRSAKGVTAFAWFVAGQTLWIFGFIVELVTPSLFGKIFWDSFQWLAGLLLVIAFPTFAAQYTEFKFHNPRRMFYLALVVPALFTATLITDSLHHLIYSNPRIVSSLPYSELTYDFTWAVYGYALYGYGITLWSIGVLVRRVIHPHNLYRVQTLIIVAASSRDRASVRCGAARTARSPSRAMCFASAASIRRCSSLVRPTSRMRRAART